MYTARQNLIDLSRDLRQNRISLLQFVNDLCDRIEMVDPHLHSLLPEPNRRTRLLNEAKDIQERYPNPDRRPLLYGIPVGVKDVLRTDGLLTQAGSQLPAELFAGKEAVSVSMLRKAGALILGKTVTAEFAYYEPGSTVNPHNIEHTPGGSSSGSAAAVAAGFCPLALGTQTGGSTIRPASFCGIVGFKPSYDRIDTGGIIPCSKSLDHVGLFTQDVKGMKLAASLLCNDWLGDQENLKTKNTGSPVLGVPEGPYLTQMPPESLELFESHLKRLEQAGYSIRRVLVFENLEHIMYQHGILVAREMADVHAEWFDKYGSLYRLRTRENILRGKKISDDDLGEAQDTQLGTRHEIETKMEDASIDLWVCPSTLRTAPKGIESTGDPAMNSPWTYTGLPVITIPVDVSEDGLPIGLQLVSQFMADEQLIAHAEEISEVFCQKRIDNERLD